jgi:hypothetical protein
MSIDRRIELQLALQQRGDQFKDFGSQARQDQPHPEAQAGAQERFDRAMAGAAAPSRSATPSATDPAALPLADHNARAQADPGAALAFFGLPAARIAPAAGADVGVPTALNRQLGEAVEQLLVDDGSGGGNRQIRLQLKDDVLAGVTVVIQECEGRLQVDFICAEEAARLKLNRIAPEHAQLLAQRLAREVLLRVQTDDEEFPCLYEVAASP